MKENQDTANSLLKTLEALEKMKVVQIYEDKKRLFYYNFIAGIARGLGTVIGATLVLAILVFVLTRLQWVPLVGDTISDLLNYLETSRALPTQ